MSPEYQSSPDDVHDQEALSGVLGAAVIIHAAGDAEVGDDAGLSGVLEDREGCAVVVTERGQAYLPSFPVEFTRADHGDASLSWGVGTAAKLGESFSADGGFHSTVHFEIPQECQGLGLEEVFMVRPR